MPLMTIISGFQTGADMGGILAAHDLGIPTWGWMPKGFKTEDGPRPEYADLYGALESPFDSYAKRTKLNVYESDATIIFATKPDSAGTKLTVELCESCRRPCEIVKNGFDLTQFIADNNVRILNVAGNRESVSPGLQERVRNYLKRELVYLVDNTVE